MSDIVRILGISGSLRAKSFNTALLRAAGEMAPSGVIFELYDELGDIPPYNEDVLSSSGYPDVVQRLRAKISAFDAVLFASPEYNRSVPGVLKNAIDWASRPPAQPFAGKPVAVIGASPGGIGTALANYSLRQVLSILGAQIVTGGEVLVGGAAQKFDEQGRLVDDSTRKHVAAQLEALQKLAVKLK